ncbi:pseudouridine synthase [Candidatus Vidania fulgoroideorum]
MFKVNNKYFLKKIDFIKLNNAIAIDCLYKCSSFVAFYKIKYVITYKCNNLDKRNCLISILLGSTFPLNFNIKRFGLVNRLDFLSEGIVIFCLKLSFLILIKNLRKKGLITKHYLVNVIGKFPKNKVKSNNILKKNKNSIGKECVCEFSLVSYLKHGDKYISLVNCITNSGRYHQIRKQLKIIGYSPIGEFRNCKKKYFFLQFYAIIINNFTLKIPFSVNTSLLKDKTLKKGIFNL